ncbi:MAG: phosphatase PAP2 family protein [Methanobacteriota archaeon]
MVVYLLASFPIGVWAFAGKKVSWDGLRGTCDKYRWHIAMLIGLFALKSLIMSMEGAVEGAFAWDATSLIHSVEGDAALQVQKTLLSDWMTVAMGLVYIGSFLFIYVFSVLLFAYSDNFKAAGSLMFMNLVLLLLSIPFYFLMIVKVTSWPLMFEPGATAIVPGMQPLLYNYNDMVHGFFVSYDTFNNSFPSMHIGYPAAIPILLWRQEPKFRGYKIFLGIMIFLISLSIVYLGIHWFLDILGGFAAALVAVYLAERYSKPFWKMAYKLVKREWNEADWV